MHLDYAMNQDNEEFQNQETRLARLELEVKDCKDKYAKLLEEKEAEKLALQFEIERNSYLKRELEIANINLDKIRSELLSEISAKHDIYSSNSWRLTAPLRWVSIHLSQRRRDL